METVCVIPARYTSQRFEGKVIVPLFGKPLVQWVWEKAIAAQTIDEVIIATDDERVFKTCKDFGAKVQMTSPHHFSGTDRVCEVVSALECEIVINLQADEPLIQPQALDELVLELKKDKDLQVCTLIKKIETEEELEDPNIVKVVIDRYNFALYFSRAKIPYIRDKNISFVFYKHIGVYGFKRDFLFTFKNLPKGKLEKAEGLEQLRILEAGFKIKTIEINFESISVDTPQDLERVKEFIKDLGHA